jgi:hypothetical protein
MLLLVGGDVGAGERFVEPKLLEWIRSAIVSWRGGRDRLLLKCGRLDWCVFAEDGGGYGRLKSRMALTPDPVLKKFKKLGELLQAMFLTGPDLALRGWCLSRLASWLGVSLAPMTGLITGASLLRRQRRFVLGSCGDDRLQQYNWLYLPYIMLLVCVPTLYHDIYQYK